MWGAGTGPSGGGGGNPWSQPPPPQIEAQHNVNNDSQWSMNPNHYTNIPHNQVDWAALAQQWMILKQAGGTGARPQQQQHNMGMPVPGGMGVIHGLPQPPHVQNMFGNNNVSNPSMHPVMQTSPFHHLGRSNSGMTQQLEDGPPGVSVNPHHGPRGDNVTSLGDIIGETPMELESLDPEPPQKPNNDMWKTTQNNWYSPEINNPWSTGAAMNTPLGDGNRNSEIQSMNLTTSSPAMQQLRPTMKQTKHTRASSNEYGNYSTNSGYWTSNDDGSKDGPSAAVVTDDFRFESAVQPYSAYLAVAAGAEYSSDDNSMPEMDAAKRKTLPIWIRDGLEKMERQKKKKEEEARLAEEKEELRKRLIEEQKNAAVEEDPQISTEHSKWNNQSESRPASNDEESDDEHGGDNKGYSPKKTELPTLASILKNLSPEEQDDAIMYAIRRVSTTVLVKVTNDIIYDVASDASNRAKTRKKVTPTIQIPKTSALASIAGGFGLGLGGYGSGSEDSNSSEDEENGNESGEDNKGDIDSEEELMEEIARKKRNWEMLKLETKHKPRSRSSSAIRNEEIPSSQIRLQNPEDTIDSSGTSKSHAHNSRELREVDKAIVPSSFEDPNNTTATGNHDIKLTNKSDKKQKSEDEIPKTRSNSTSRSIERSGNGRRHRSRSRSSSRCGGERKSRSSKSWSRSRSRSQSPPRRRNRRDRSRSRSWNRYKSRSRSISKSSRKRSRSKSTHRHRSKKSRSISKDRNFSNSPSTSKSRRRRSRSRSSSREHHRDRSRDRRHKRSKSKEIKRPGSQEGGKLDNTRSIKPRRSSSIEKSKTNSHSSKHSRKINKTDIKEDHKEESFTKPKQKISEKSRHSSSRSRSRSASRSSINFKASDRSKVKDNSKTREKHKEKSKKSKKKVKKSRHRSRSSSSSRS